jgi:CubicO group peptidase (beta-lactamase class C family)
MTASWRNDPRIATTRREPLQSDRFRRRGEGTPPTKITASVLRPIFPMKFLLLLLLLAVAPAAALFAAPLLPSVKPEEAGMSTERLKRIDQFVARLEAEGKLAGAVTVVARRGQVVSIEAHGLADIETKRPMRTDDIFHLQSMTKPIATVAVLMLLEEGRFLLSDPVEKYLPEFHDMKVAVARADAPEGYGLVPAERAITIHDLLTHRAGFTGVPPSGGPAEALRRKAVQALPADGNFTLEEAVKNLAASPLDAQPGTIFRYGPSAVVLGRLVEVVSGRTLEQFFQERIFEPLGMKDTFFSVPESKRARVVPAYTTTPDKGLVKLPPDPRTTRFFSGGGNLYSTPADFLRFCQMLLNGGEFDGHRLLGRKAVELMTTKTVETMTIPFMRGQYFGLGVAVQKADGESGLLGSPGTYGWSGSYNTYLRIDPHEQLILLFFTQQAFSPASLELQYGFQNSVMQAIVD